MNFLRAITASLLSLLCTLTISAFIVLSTLQVTLFDRHELKGWLAKSNAYQTTLSDILGIDKATPDQPIQQNLITALNQTFTPVYAQQSAEKVLDGVYDWLEGDQPLITFAIDTPSQRDAFVSNAAAALKPTVSAFPRCSRISEFNSQNPTCLPLNTSVEQLAQSIAIDAGNQLSFFQEPITNQSIARASGQLNSPLTSPRSTAQSIPLIMANVRLALIILPIIAALSAVLVIVLSRDHLKAARYLAGRLSFGLAITAIFGGVASVVAGNFSVGNLASGVNSTVLNQIIDPVLRQAMPAIGTRLALVSGGLALGFGVAWIIFRLFYKRKERAKHDKAQLPPAAQTPAQNLPPTQPPAITQPPDRPTPPLGPTTS